MLSYPLLYRQSGAQKGFQGRKEYLLLPSITSLSVPFPLLPCVPEFPELLI